MVQIQLEDQVAAALESRARAHGLSLEAYLAEIAARDLGSSETRVSGEEAIRLITSEAGPGNPSYEGTYPRDDIYIDHD
jgi:plasmid stability protein